MQAGKGTITSKGLTDGRVGRRAAYSFWLELYYLQFINEMELQSGLSISGLSL